MKINFVSSVGAAAAALLGVMFVRLSSHERSPVIVIGPTDTPQPVAAVPTASAAEPLDPPATVEPPTVARHANTMAEQSPSRASVATRGEASLMAELRAIHLSDPELSLRLAREGNQRFPSSPDAAERAATIVKSLMRMGRGEEATAEARAMVAAYPGTSWAADVKHHMLDVPSYLTDSAER